MSFFATRAVRRLFPVAVIAALTVGAGATAGADAATQSVSGTTTSTLALASTSPGVLTGLVPGGSATGTGTLTVVSTLGSWTLSVNDTASSNAGHLQAAASGCANSESALVNPLSITVSAVTGAGSTGSLTPTAAVSLSGTQQTVATGSGSEVIATNYTNAIGSSEALRTGCAYSLTATYTAQ